MPIPTSRTLPGILLPLAALWLGMAPSTLDYRVQDLINQALAADASEQIVIVAIDEKSLAQLGRWPWPRELLAEAIGKLGHARAVGLNLLLAEHSEHPESDQALARAIAQNGKVYLPAFPEPDGTTLRPTLPLPMLAHAARGVGVSDFPPESNGEIRRTYLASGPGDTRLPSFAALVAGQSTSTTSSSNPGDWGRSQPRLLPHLDSDTRFTTIPMAELLSNNQADPRLQDKTVFVGVTAAGSGDEHFTAIQRNQAKSNGVFINAALAQGLQQNTLATPLSPGWRAGLLLALALGWQLLARRRKSLHPIRQAALFVGGMLLGDTLLYQLLHIELGTATLGLLILMAATSNFFLLQSHFKKLAFTDKLTGLANRHHFDERIVLALQHSQLERQALALLVLDVDHFKRYNDHYGHAAGDDILRQIAQVIASMARSPQDTVARIGGEEFALLLPDASQKQAEAIATELRYRLLSRQIPHHSSPLGRVSCSIGIYADTPEPDATVRSIFEQADQALYQAKRNGRDQACVADGLLATRI
ncbi:diguanylate cyclase [Vogesella sp. DC21W]|uniref:diguanylate cyclase n=1 Tax=Vogesella aquatica TaxID=2984206 RepID=A0ABT5IYC4_9NEIS|nr:diguanylate cyclase [Vogesella aquatica]MDC7717585.1 diguanylate cyclase [Vogesella aquatica]